VVRMIRLTIMVVALCTALPAFAGTEGELVDPMRPLHYRSAPAKKAQKEVPASVFRFTAVLTSSQRSVAVINQKFFKVGDTIEGYKVVTIDFDKVLLKNKKKTVVLHRVGTGLKKISATMDIRKGSNL